MKKYLFCFILVMQLCSCSESDKNKKEEKPALKINIPVALQLTGCYEMIIATDTAFLKIEQNAQLLNGFLKYKRKEKDSNTGTVILTISENRAEGYYTFQSEGQTSVRQIVFKISNNGLAEAYGDIKMQNDTAVYTYPHALNFEEKHSFNKISCK